MSKTLVKAPEVSITEEQSLCQSQDMLLSVFSSIAYIRDLFSEDSYESIKVATINTKRLRRGSSSQVNQLLDWIEKGCFDAIQKKYLESVTLGILEDPGEPDTVVESYTLSFDYPSSKPHQELRSVIGGDYKMKLTMFKGGSEKTIGASFQTEIMSLLRSLCVMTQALGQLPGKRFLTMQVTYFDELTPRDYEPPGFLPIEFDVSFLFNQPTMKHSFGHATSGHHCIGLSLETTCTEPNTIESRNEALVPGTVENASSKEEDVVEDAGEANCAQQTLSKSFSKVKLAEEPRKKFQNETQVVRCSCEDNETDLDMIQCDYCGSWQHTPCVGYCSNRDKRIPKDNYKCYHCQFGHTKKIMLFLKEFSCTRRVIAILYTDGVASITDLADRLSCPIKKASRILAKVEDEGLMKREIKGTKHIFTTCSGQNVKNKLNFYFGPDPEQHPDFPCSSGSKRKHESGAVEINAASISASKDAMKRRKSETSVKING